MGSLLSYLYSDKRSEKTFLEKYLREDKWGTISNESEIVFILKKYISTDVASLIVEMMRDDDYRVIKIPIEGQKIEVLYGPSPKTVIQNLWYSSSSIVLSHPICPICKCRNKTYECRIKFKLDYVEYCFNCGIGFTEYYLARDPEYLYLGGLGTINVGDTYIINAEKYAKTHYLSRQILAHYVYAVNGITLCKHIDNDIILGEAINRGILRFKTHNDFLSIFKSAKINISRILLHEDKYCFSF